MQIEFKLKRFLLVFFGLVILWVIFLTSRFLLSEQKNLNHSYVPENAAFVAHFDGKLFFETAIYDLFFTSENKEIFEQIKTLSSREKDFEIRDAGIDFVSDIIVFGQQDQAGQWIGALFNVTDSEQFRQNAAGFISGNQSFAANDEVAVLLTWVPVNKNVLLPNRVLQQKANSLLVKTGKKVTPGKSVSPHKFMSLKTNASNKHAFGTGSLESWIDGSLFAFKGEFEHKNFPVSSWSLKPNGFHIVNRIFPQSMQDSLKKALQSKGYDLPEIAGILLNYRGTKMTADGTIPQMELLIEFESEMTSAQIEQLQQPNDFNLLTRILDPKTIFIGLEANNLVTEKNKHAFLLKGDLTNLTKIEGGGLAVVGLNFYPPYKASKQFFEAVSIADIQVVPQNGKWAIDGKIQFKEGKYPVSETLQVILTLMN